jgi:hypothetical protein
VPSNRWVQCAGLMAWLASITGTAPGLLLHASGSCQELLSATCSACAAAALASHQGTEPDGEAGATQAADVPVSASADTARSSATPSHNPEPGWSSLAALGLMCNSHV